MISFFYCQTKGEIKMKFLERLFAPIIAIFVLIDESKRQNLDGSWDKYHKRRNKRKECK